MVTEKEVELPLDRRLSQTLPRRPYEGFVYGRSKVAR